MSSLPESLMHFRTDLENAIGLELARQRTGRRRRRLLAVAAAGLVVTVASASAFGTVRDFFFGARQSVTSGAPTWSPDGQRIAFVSTTCLPDRPPCAGPSEIVVVGLDGSAQRKLSQDPVRTGLGAPPVLSPNWRKIAFARDRGLYREYLDGTSLHYSDIVVMSVDGSRRRVLTPRGFYTDPVWSPDGSKIAFVRSHGDDADVYVVEADGAGRRKLAHAISYPSNPYGVPKSPAPNPAWSPDGRKIAFTSNRDGNEDIYVVDVEGGGLVNLTRSRGTDRKPVWSPDGRLIAFRGDRDGNGEVYVMNADGSAQRRLTRNPAPDNGPVWSPDGRRILFQRALGDIWVMNRDGSGQRNLTPDVRPARIAWDWSPAWSPDGRLIAFLSERDNTRKVYVMTAAGGEPAALGEFVDEGYAVGRISRSAGGVRFSLSVPRTRPFQWENGPSRPGTFRVGSLRISRSLVRGQSAEVVIYWTAFPGGGQVAPCSKLLSPDRGRSIDDLAAVFSRAPGTELVAGPTHVTVGGRTARRLELVVREDLGCQPGYFFAWREPWGGSFWGGTEEGDRIRAWIVDVDGKRLVFVAETKEGFNHPLRPPPPKAVLQRVAREIAKIVESIRFE